MFKKLLILILIGICYFNSNSSAQEVKCFISFTADTSENIGYKDLKINVFQKDSLSKWKVNDQIPVYIGADITVEFESTTITIPGLKNFRVFKDSVILFSTRTLKEVIVSARKRIVRQTLTGFDYYPSKDSLFKSKSLFVAMQRLPFVKIFGEELEYRDQEKILFKINGKERKGVGNNWNDILKAVKAKDIYKVELITEVPTLARNQGFTVIINIMTLEANIYGKTFNAALILDQRENLNKNIGLTVLRKRADFSLKLSNLNDNRVSHKTTQVYENKNLISENKFASIYSYKLYSSSFDYGLRLDSANDINLRVELRKNRNNTSYFNNYNFPVALIDQRNLLDRDKGTISLSYIHRKNKFVTKSMSASINIEEQRIQNRQSFMYKKDNDSINRQTNSTPRYWILEYNYFSTKHKTYKTEYGIQVYNKQLNQDFSDYNLDSQTNVNHQRLYFKRDSLSLDQYSIRSYFKLDKRISDRKALSFDMNNEFYSIKNRYSTRSNFLLPTISLRYKQILKENTSILLNSSFNYLKPTIEYLSPIQMNVDPIENKIGSQRLIPAKIVNTSLELIRTKKASVSHSVYASHSFDQINFFTIYDTIKKTLISSSNNGGKGYGVGYQIRYQQQFGKKLNISADGGISYVINRNTIYNSQYSGVVFRGGHNIGYSMGPKYGTLGFLSFINSKQISYQGFFQGTILYSAYYSKPVLKKRLIISLDASQFLLKNRTLNTYTSNEIFERFSFEETPYRLLSFRIAYNWSNIRVSKFAKRKATYITGEVPE